MSRVHSTRPATREPVDGASVSSAGLVVCLEQSDRTDLMGGLGRRRLESAHKIRSVTLVQEREVGLPDLAAAALPAATSRAPRSTVVAWRSSPPPGLGRHRRPRRPRRTDRHVARRAHVGPPPVHLRRGATREPVGEPPSPTAGTPENRIPEFGPVPYGAAAPVGTIGIAGSRGSVSLIPS
jgi:hypothetical protein